MGKKILIVSASLRKNSNSELLAGEILDRPVLLEQARAIGASL